MRKWLTILEALSGPVAIALVLAVSTAVGAMDWWTGNEVSLSFFYLLPIFLAGWRLKTAAILIFALLNTAISLAAHALAGQNYSQGWIYYWNAAMRLGSYVLVGLLVTRVRRSLEREQTLARTDSLTDVLNRRAFEEVVAKEIDRMERGSGALVLATFDLDDFKAMNDTHGHGAGDRVLREVGRVLKENLRQHDISARLGGDEFALLLPMTTAGQAYDLCVRLKLSLEDAMKAKSWSIGFSFGAVEAKAGDQFATLLDRADRLMYRVKHDGKNGILVQNPA